MAPEDLLELKLIKEIAKFQLNDSNLSTDNLIGLINIVTSKQNLTKRIRVIVLNYVIVAAYRFNLNLSYEKLIQPCHEKLLNLIQSSSQNDFGNKLRTSIAYRGLAMVNEIDMTLRNDYLKKSEFIARNVAPSNNLESLVAKENLYTCLQTLAKWNQQIDQLELSKANLLEMIALDPFDSTGYAELAFFLFDQNNFEQASVYFKHATELGPPAVGMHTYYYAKCLQFLNKNDDAMNAFYKSTELDNQAVSPWVDLIHCHIDIKQTNKAHEIAKLLLTEPIYRSQLEEEEIKQIEKLTQ